FFRDVHAGRDLFVRGVASQLLEQRGGALADAVQRARAVERHAHDARLLGQRLQNGLANPPDRVRDELDALRLVEFVRGANEAEVALVDQIRERHALVLILLRDRHDEAQVGAHQLVQGFLLALADALRETDLLVAIDQRIDADVTQILIERAFLERRLLLAGDGHTAGGSWCGGPARPWTDKRGHATLGGRVKRGGGAR